MKENWKNLVGYQKLKSADSDIMYLTVNKTEETVLSIGLIKTKVQCDLSLDEMITELEKLVYKFPVVEYNPDHENADVFALHKAKNDIAKDSRRGVGNAAYQNVVMYKGIDRVNDEISCSDAGIIVAEFDGKYGIFVHPNFSHYGRVVTSMEH